MYYNCVDAKRLEGLYLIKENEKLLILFRVIIDAGIIIGVFILSYFLRFDTKHSPLLVCHLIRKPHGFYPDLGVYMQCLVALVPSYIISYWFFRLYDPGRIKKHLAESASVIGANLVGIIIVTAILFFYRTVSYARLFVLIFVITNTVATCLIRLLISVVASQIRKNSRHKKRVLLVGYSNAAKGYIDRLKANPEWGYTIDGILDDNAGDSKHYKDVKVLGTTDKLETFLNENDYDEIVITLAIDHFDKLESIVNIAENHGIHTKFVPDYKNVIPTRPYTEDLDGLPVIHVRKVPLSLTVNRFIKRTFDIVGSILLIILTSIPMLIIAILVKASSPGPILFKQTRVGLHNKPFTMYKFRSLKVQDEDNAQWTVKNDPNVTKIGRFIRRTSLDEFPQFFNVLSGKMSLVGPRPERPVFVEKFRAKIPRYMIKHQVRPGITGWAQINGFRGDTSIPKRIDYDLYYVENWSMGLDIKILFLTIFKGFVNKNAY